MAERLHPQDILKDLPKIGPFFVINDLNIMNRIQDTYHDNVAPGQLLSQLTLYNKSVLADAREILVNRGIVTLVCDGSEYYKCDFDKCKDYLVQEGVLPEEIASELAKQGVDISGLNLVDIADAVLSENKNLFSVLDNHDDKNNLNISQPSFGDEPR